MEWLTRWKDQNNIIYRKVHSEKQDADSASAENWRKNVWVKLIKDYKTNQIFNADESSLFFAHFQNKYYCLKMNQLLDVKS